MSKTVNIVNRFSSLIIDRIFKIDSKSTIADKMSLTLICITHID